MAKLRQTSLLSQAAGRESLDAGAVGSSVGLTCERVWVCVRACVFTRIKNVTIFWSPFFGPFFSDLCLSPSSVLV